MAALQNYLAAGLGFAFCLAGTVARAPERPPSDAPRPQPAMTISLSPALLRISADVAGDIHADGLERFVDERFPEHDAEIYWRISQTADTDWQLLTWAALDLLAETSLARMHVEPGRLRLEGLRPRGGLFDVRLARVRETASAELEVAETGTAVIPEAACQTMFATLGGEPIRFYIGTEDLRPSSLPLLDRYAEFASDCPDSRLTVVGHTDASGDEAYNRYLSERRANVVVNYLVRAGMAPGRVKANGLGSSEPIADNGTYWGRSLNRRIEVLLNP